MVRTDLPYTYCSRKRMAPGTGGVPRWKDYWRFRWNGRDTPLPGAPGDPKFHARYAELLAMERSAAAPKVEKPRHSFDWLCDRYLASAEFGALAESTQLDYRRTIENHLRPVLGPERFDSINRATIKVVRDSLRAQPRTAHKVKQMASRLYSWAEEDDLVDEGFNPAAKIRKLKSKVKHIEVWSDEEVALFLASCDERGDARMRTIALLALYTGQRAEDLATMEWSQVQMAQNEQALIRVRQSKTGEMLTIPCHSVLRDHLKTIRTKFGGRIVRAADGKSPCTAHALGTAITRAVSAIDAMPRRSLHGLRYAAAGAMEAAGCSVVQISSILGHRTYQVAMQYIRQRRDAQSAIDLLEASA